MIRQWEHLADLYVEFARALNRESKTHSCKLWWLDTGAGPIRVLTKNTPGALWLGWCRRGLRYACAIEIGGYALELLNLLNRERYRLMSDLLSLEPSCREAVIGHKYRVPFDYMIRPVEWFESPEIVTLRRSDVLPELYVLRVGAEDDYEEVVTDVEVLLYSGGRPEFRIAA